MYACYFHSYQSPDYYFLVTFLHVYTSNQIIIPSIRIIYCSDPLNYVNITLQPITSSDNNNEKTNAITLFVAICSVSRNKSIGTRYTPLVTKAILYSGDDGPIEISLPISLPGNVFTDDMALLLLHSRMSKYYLNSVLVEWLLLLLLHSRCVFSL